MSRLSVLSLCGVAAILFSAGSADAGFRHRSAPAASVQYHPEAAAGPHDSAYLFTRFRQMMA